MDGVLYVYKVLDAMNGTVIYTYEGYQQQPIAITQRFMLSPMVVLMGSFDGIG